MHDFRCVLGHAEKWQDWPWSSAADFLERMGRETAEKIWREFPVLEMGKTWDFDENPD
jgi:REP-associated tyrosine transposase